MQILTTAAAPKVQVRIGEGTFLISRHRGYHRGFKGWKPIAEHHATKARFEAAKSRRSQPGLQTVGDHWGQ